MQCVVVFWERLSHEVVIARLLLEPNVASTLPEFLFGVFVPFAALDALVLLVIVDSFAAGEVVEVDVGVVEG